MPSRPAVRLSVLATFGLLIGCQSQPAASAPPPAGKETPSGKEKAAQAVRDLYRDATIGDVKEPGAESGMGGLFWVVKFRRAGKDSDQQLSVTPDGVIIHLPQQVTVAELPKSVADALAKEAGKVVRTEKQEMRATLVYAALPAPEVHYVAVLAKDAQSRRLDLSASGEVLQRHELDTEAGEEPEKAPTAAEMAKDGDYPAEAAKAVAAVKRILPHVTIKGVEEVGYLDGTGDMQVLNYEVEFFQDGVQKEWSASPDGIVIHVPMPVEAAALPPAVAKAIAGEAGWTAKRLVKEETRAALKFTALSQPRVIYVAQVEQDGKQGTLKFRPDGSRIEEVDPRALLGGKGGEKDEQGEKK
jgi:hypothetical protein